MHPNSTHKKSKTPCKKDLTHEAIRERVKEHISNIRLRGMRYEMSRLNAVAEQILLKRDYKIINTDEFPEPSPCVSMGFSQNFKPMSQDESELPEDSCPDWYNGMQMAYNDQQLGETLLPSQRNLSSKRKFHVIK